MIFERKMDKGAQMGLVGIVVTQTAAKIRCATLVVTDRDRLFTALTTIRQCSAPYQQGWTAAFALLFAVWTEVQFPL